MNKNVLRILNIIESNGYDAYVVGGYVRDYLLGIYSNDYDICTSCPLDILKSIIDYDYNIKLSTINIIIDDINIDITPYRKEIEYKDRKPIKYEYTNSLLEDIYRRDITINTICMDNKLNIIDLLGGKNDLDNKIIKCVGNIDKKISEDPLRILRIIRFKALYNFNIDKKLELGIMKYKYLLKNISYERKKIEIINLINIKRLDILFDYDLYKYLDIDISNIKYYDNILLTIMNIDVNNKYIVSNKEKNIINKVKELDSIGLSNYNIYKYGYEISHLVGLLNNINIDYLYNKLVIKSRGDINISSYDIINIVKDNKLINKVYEYIEKSILDRQINNNKSEIINYINNTILKKI